MNITLSADEKVIQRARAKARKIGKSLNQVIREMLSDFSGDGSKSAIEKELQELWKSGSGNSNGWKWSREEVQRKLR